MSKTTKILIVEDETTLREVLKINFSDKGYEVLDAGNLSKAKEIIKNERPVVVISDLRLPDGSGIELIQYAQTHRSEAQVIIITAYVSAETVLEAMNKGAFTYIDKPFKFERVETLVKQALDKSELLSENKALRAEVGRRYDFEKTFICASAAIRDIVEKLKRVADTPATVLILGESGTGKDLAARAIHYNSSRGAKNFVALNCGAIPENLLESELFGHVRGSFTGADRDKQGLFVEANGGTLFLDEIAELPHPMQVKLLRALQEGSIRPIGSSKEIKVDVRILAATNRDIEKEVQEGRFREDLYYRLNVITVKMPSLRERREDIPSLARIFLAQYASANSKTIIGFTEEAMKALLDFDYPGNTRQLQNIIQQAVYLEKGEYITLESLPEPVRPKITEVKEHKDSPITLETIKKLETLKEEVSKGEAVNFKELVDAVVCDAEMKLIQAALEKTSGNQTKAAKLLNITLRELRYRLEKHKRS